MPVGTTLVRLDDVRVAGDPSEKLAVRLDIAGQDPQFEVAIGVDGHDAGNPRFHVLVADDGMAPNRGLEAGAHIREPHS